ncbi:ABC transporter ATP-binding protein [Streptomyces bingchenggensis BCW-1]|uniref:ABC transporter ATP-binding protein n=1 Tax=Streptomyces bingchenggensis (strain BCW-1) TaxID=749414 RepID=D7C6H5_STRBB|nr:ABC transporter ATP-binding protein [Streptomyces bingchenggensis BCW-1]
MLRGVDLEVRPGSLIRVTGSNGSGKSTLLRLLAGIDAPTTGRITARPRTAYVPERFPADLPFTALGYLTHVGRVHGLGSTAAVRGAEEWLERFDAAGHAHTPLAELSKGTSQKVAVAQALMPTPDLLILDEAWTGLDQSARAALDEEVTSRVTAGGTVVYVDHDPRRLASSADEIFHITDTRLVRAPGAEGTPSPGSSGGFAVPREARVCVEAEGESGASVPEGLPGAPVGEQGLGGGVPVVRLTVAVDHSDALLRALLTARPPWHIRAVTPVAAEAEGRAPVPVSAGGEAEGRAPVSWAAGAGAGGRALPALLRYQAALLARSQRWVPPVVLYGAFMAIGVMAGQPILDSFGYAAAALLPIAAWLVRVCVNNEPAAARNCAAAAAGPARVHLSSVVTGLAAAAVLGVVGALFVALISDPKTSDQRIDVSLWDATAAGLLAALTCVLLGAAIGALLSRPLLLSTGWGIQATAAASLLVLVASASPANAAVSDLVSGSQTGTVTLPLLPLAMTGAAAAGATALACALSSRRS